MEGVMAAGCGLEGGRGGGALVTPLPAVREIAAAQNNSRGLAARCQVKHRGNPESVKGKKCDGERRTEEKTWREEAEH